MSEKHFAVLGAGSWGTALALVLARKACHVTLWDIDAQLITHMQEKRCNERYLPTIALPDLITPIADLKAAVRDVRDILIVVPSHAFRSLLHAIKPHVRSDVRLAWATKGLDPDTGELLHHVVQKEFGTKVPLAVLSGPTFAREVAQGLPSAITLSCNDSAFSEDLIAAIHQETFRIYPNHDMIGVQLGGAVKNVLAVAAGIADGLGFGTNARTAIITRGLAEMTRLGVAMGAVQETFYGLAGLGDLVLTCSDNQSRNRRFGLAIGQGISVQQATVTIGQVVEAVHTTREIYNLAKRIQVEMPIVEQVYQVLYQGVTPMEAAHHLMQRELSNEY